MTNRHSTFIQERDGWFRPAIIDTVSGEVIVPFRAQEAIDIMYSEWTVWCHPRTRYSNASPQWFRGRRGALAEARGQLRRIREKQARARRSSGEFVTI